MQDCRLTMTVENDVVNFTGEGISMEELAAMTGFLQVFVGTEGIRRGASLDDVKDNLLDIHLAAVETIEGQLRDGTLPGGEDQEGD